MQSTNRFNNQEFYILPHFIYVFYTYLRTNSKVFSKQHKLIGFNNRYGKCLLRGTNWAFKFRNLRFVSKGLNKTLEVFTLSSRLRLNDFVLQ
jgi:enolase